MANIVKAERSSSQEPIRISFSLPRLRRPRDPKLIAIALLTAGLTYSLSNGCIRDRQELDKQRNEINSLKEEIKAQSYPSSFTPDPNRDTAKDPVTYPPAETPAAAPAASAPAPTAAPPPPPAPAPAPRPRAALGPGGLDTPYPRGASGPGDF